MNLLASLHNKFTCVDRTGDVELPSPMARWGLKTGRATSRKPALLALYVRYGMERQKTFFHGWCIIRRLFQLGVWFNEWCMLHAPLLLAPMQPPTGSSSTGPLPIPFRASTASVAKPHAVAPLQPPVFPVVTPNPLKTVEGLDLTWSSDPFQTDTDKAVKLHEEYIKQFRKHPSLGYTGTPAKAKLPAAKVAAQRFASPISGKGKKDKMRYGHKKRVRGGSTPQGEEYDDDMGELICKKHKKEQKRVPTNFIFDPMLTYRDLKDNRLGMAISIFRKRTKETRFNITIRCLRLREEKEDGSAVLEWDGGNILVSYCSVEKEIISHSMDERGYYVVDVETYQEVTADDEGSVYRDEEEEGTVVEA